jgi:LAO/AO transport system kinase
VEKRAVSDNRFEMSLAGALLSGDVRALARAISLAEDRDPQASQLVAELQSHTGNAYLVGLTGAPGTGKSTLADALVKVIRDRQQTVGVIAVDPSSPFTGGAVLGDRIRMGRHTLDKGVFIRSMGARGHLGGLAAATREAIHLLDAYGRDVILVETVGVGQSELEISTICDTVVLVLMPESGDAVQSIKAGILEIADVFVINKSDLGGAEKTRRLIQDSIGLGPKQAWRPPIVLASAAKEEGIEPVWDAVLAHQAYLTESGTLASRRQQRLKQEVMALVADRAREDARRVLEGDTAVGRRVRENRNGKLNPYALAEEVLEQRAPQGGS